MFGHAYDELCRDRRCLGDFETQPIDHSKVSLPKVVLEWFINCMHKTYKDSYNWGRFETYTPKDFFEILRVAFLTLDMVGFTGHQCFAPDP